MAESKKAWVEPELIVLVRSKPEEAVLGNCKTYSGGVSNLVAAFSCGNYNYYFDCVQCSVIAGS